MPIFVSPKNKKTKNKKKKKQKKKKKKKNRLFMFIVHHANTHVQNAWKSLLFTHNNYLVHIY